MYARIFHWPLLTTLRLTLRDYDHDHDHYRDHYRDHERDSCSLLMIDIKRDLASLSPLHAVLDEMYAGNCAGFCAS
jgi:hypothetical protein